VAERGVFEGERITDLAGISKGVLSVLSLVEVG
jgi:hypothetical protein